MAESIGKMALYLSANVEGLKNGLAHGKRDIEDFSKGTLGTLKGALSKMGGQFSGVGSRFGLAGLAVGAYAGYVAHVAKEMKELTRESERIGVGVEAMQAYGNAAKKAGADVGQVADAVNKMQKLIAESGDKEESRKKLALVGLKPEDLAGKGTEKQFETIAKQIASIKDSTTRARVEMELFGDSGAKLDPVFKQIAEGKTGLVLPKEAVERYTRVGTAVKAIGEGVSFAAKEIASLPLTPIAETLELMADVINPGWRERWAEYKRATEDASKAAAQLRREQEQAALAAGGQDIIDRLKKQYTDRPAWMEDRDKFLKDAKDLEAGQRDAIAQRIAEEGQLAERRRAEMDDRVRAHQEVEAAIKASATAEEEFLAATREAHDWAQRGVITRQEEAALIGRAQKNLMDSWNKTTQQLKLPELVIKGSAEEYKAIVQYQAQLEGQKNQEQRLAELVAEQKRGNAILQAIADKTEVEVVASVEG